MPPCRTIFALLPLLLAAPLSAAPLDCVIEPRATVSLTSTEQGRIEAVLVRRGDTVSAGQPLLRLEDRVQQLQLRMAEAKAGSEAELAAARARLKFREEELARAEALFERKAASSTAVEDKRIEVTLSQLALDEAEAGRRRAALERELAQAMLERRVIRSPADGIVLSVEAAAGEYATDTAEMLVLAEMDPLLVEVFVPLDYHDRIAVGDTYEVAQAAPLTGRFSARVRTVDRVFDAASGTFGVQLELPNPGAAIPAGTRCQVDFDAPGQ
ncbi:efflux RND transporter periplasmic adaptor subunit [Pseudooceanicola sp. CBS1P-1]|uniref:Efflux RND transporter periplasmic adaptor subunit n=1 Tax=Pseudooceanicola albus TaxID=2692189 RepID=A0A6L7G6K1_9RHOB|nr:MULTISPECIES: efflux RND transporter periplasmic adaptor subunit [Pseudooceanicola]MBT9384338.1 efflux RND transporter periplasmic adaptor subunit [Pseudooceanicola endophyticus]MXN19924.1 efflux RND transporter periplasmic adaptor subunit [Pseudooceanicola albus]